MTKRLGSLNEVGAFRLSIGKTIMYPVIAEFFHPVNEALA